MKRQPGRRAGRPKACFTRETLEHVSLLSSSSPSSSDTKPTSPEAKLTFPWESCFLASMGCQKITLEETFETGSDQNMALWHWQTSAWWPFRDERLTDGRLVSVDSKGLNQINWELVEFCQVARQNLGGDQKRIGRQGEFQGFCGRFTLTVIIFFFVQMFQTNFRVHIYWEKCEMCGKQWLEKLRWATAFCISRIHHQ